MILILDAYNVIHKIPSLEAKLDHDLRAARDALIELAGQLVSRRGDISEIILVFDGQTEFQDLDQPSPRQVRIIFSETDEEADKRIEAVVMGLAETSKKCIVSDDNFVRNVARAHRVQTLTVREFDALSQPQASRARKPATQPSASKLPPALAKDITDAYRKELGL